MGAAAAPWWPSIGELAWPAAAGAAPPLAASSECVESSVSEPLESRIIIETCRVLRRNQKEPEGIRRHQKEPDHHRDVPRAELERRGARV